MPDEPDRPGTYAPDPNLPSPPKGTPRVGRPMTEAELTATARAAVDRQRKPDGSAYSQREVAAAFGVPQSVLSQALGYSRTESNRSRGHELRRRIIRAWHANGTSRLSFAGPFWIPVGPDGMDAPGEKGKPIADRFTAGEDPYPHGDGKPAPEKLPKD